MRSPATPARRPSRSSPANAKRHPFAGAATSAYAPRSARSLIAPATGTPGRRTSTPPLAPAATTTPARYVPSGGRGLGSYGAARKTVCPMTPPATAPCNDISLSPFPHRRAPAPTSLPHSGWPAPLSPEGRPAGPSAQRLTASRHPLSRPGVDTGRLLSLPGRASGKRGRGPRWDAVEAANKTAASGRSLIGHPGLCLGRRRERASIACPLSEGQSKTSPSRRW